MMLVIHQSTYDVANNLWICNVKTSPNSQIQISVLQNLDLTKYSDYNPKRWILKDDLKCLNALRVLRNSCSLTVEMIKIKKRYAV